MIVIVTVSIALLIYKLSLCNNKQYKDTIVTMIAGKLVEVEA